MNHSIAKPATHKRNPPANIALSALGGAVLGIAALAGALNSTGGGESTDSLQGIPATAPALARVDPSMTIYLVESEKQAEFVRGSRVSTGEEQSLHSFLILLAGTPEEEAIANMAMNEVSDAWERDGYPVHTIDFRSPK